jgi:hypothetical protein
MMHRLGIVPQRLLCEPLRVTAGFGAFGPSVAVAVERRTCDAKLMATLFEQTDPFCQGLACQPALAEKLRPTGWPKLACERRLEMTFEESSSRAGFY